MHDEPASLPKDLLAQTLEKHWRMKVQSLEYAPVGFGSYHWIAAAAGGERWFITADNLAFLGQDDSGDAGENLAGLRAAYQTAMALQQAGLSFVVAPVQSANGELVIRATPDWAVVVLPFIEGVSSGPGAWTDVGRRLIATRQIGELHSAKPPAALRRWDASIPHRRELTAALDALDHPWRSGPFSDRLQSMLSKARLSLEASLRRHDALAEQVVASPEPWVVTHGEPHSANFISSSNGRMLLIDWDTVQLAPRERDLETVVGDDAGALAAYQAIAGPTHPRPEAMELFSTRWLLADICVYVRWFRRPHGVSLDLEASFTNLKEELDQLMGV
jgi:spectinomycin phosphotransferase